MHVNWCKNVSAEKKLIRIHKLQRRRPYNSVVVLLATS